MRWPPWKGSGQRISSSTAALCQHHHYLSDFPHEKKIALNSFRIEDEARIRVGWACCKALCFLFETWVSERTNLLRRKDFLLTSLVLRLENVLDLSLQLCYYPQHLPPPPLLSSHDMLFLWMLCQTSID